MEEREKRDVGRWAALGLIYCEGNDGEESLKEVGDPRDAHLPYGSQESKSCCPTGVRPTVPVRAHPGSCTLPPQMLPRVSSTPPPPIIAAADAILEDSDVHEGGQLGDS